jgi:hypothetical protein
MRFEPFFLLGTSLHGRQLSPHTFNIENVVSLQPYLPRQRSRHADSALLPKRDPEKRSEIESEHSMFNIVGFSAIL